MEEKKKTPSPIVGFIVLKSDPVWRVEPRPGRPRTGTRPD